jgi:hypothetical protein
MEQAPNGLHVTQVEAALLRELDEAGNPQTYRYGHTALLAASLQSKGLALVQYLGKGMRVQITDKGRKVMGVLA